MAHGSHRARWKGKQILVFDWDDVDGEYLRATVLENGLVLYEPGQAIYSTSIHQAIRHLREFTKAARAR